MRQEAWQGQVRVPRLPALFFCNNLRRYVWGDGGLYDGEYKDNLKQGRGVQAYATDGKPPVGYGDYVWFAGVWATRELKCES